jgi:T5orf172 domain
VLQIAAESFGGNICIMRGYVYVLSNPAFPNLTKVGRTTDLPELRVKQLNTTGVPSAFVLECCFLVEEPAEIEKQIHGALSTCRHSSNREFFNLSIAEITDVVFQTVLKSRSTTTTAVGKATKPSHNLGETEVLLLQILVRAGGANGSTEWELRNSGGINVLDLEIHLATLFAAKFVTRKAASAGSHGLVWRCTPKGTKFLVDHELVERWMYPY